MPNRISVLKETQSTRPRDPNRIDIPIILNAPCDLKIPALLDLVENRIARPHVLVDSENKFTFSEIYVSIYDYGIFNRFTQTRA